MPIFESFSLCLNQMVPENQTVFAYCIDVASINRSKKGKKCKFQNSTQLHTFIQSDGFVGSSVTFSGNHHKLVIFAWSFYCSATTINEQIRLNK